MILERADWSDATNNGQLKGTAAKRVRPRDRCPGCGHASDAWLARRVLETDGNEFHDGDVYDSMVCRSCGYTLPFVTATKEIGGKEVPV